MLGLKLIHVSKQVPVHWFLEYFLFNTSRPTKSTITLWQHFLTENVYIFTKNSQNYIPVCPTDNNLAVDKRMAWHRTGYKPKSEPMTDAYMHHSALIY